MWFQFCSFVLVISARKPNFCWSGLHCFLLGAVHSVTPPPLSEMTRICSFATPQATEQLKKHIVQLEALPFHPAGAWHFQRQVPGRSLTGRCKEGISLPPTHSLWEEEEWEGAMLHSPDGKLPRLGSGVSPAVQARRFPWTTVENGLDGEQLASPRMLAYTTIAPPQLFLAQPRANKDWVRVSDAVWEYTLWLCASEHTACASSVPYHSFCFRRKWAFCMLHCFRVELSD